MEVYDIIMIVLLVGTMIFGAYKGLAWQVASLGAIIASCFVTIRFQAPLAAVIKTNAPWNTFLAMLILYVGTSLVIWIAFRFVSDFIDRLKLKEFDRQLGAVLGLAKGVLLCMIVTLFAVTLLGEAQRRSIIHSYSGYYIAKLLDRSHTMLPPQVHEVLDPYIHSLDQRLGEHDRTAHDEPAATSDPNLFPVEELLQAFDRNKDDRGARR
ncbi:MAG: colicin V production protein [Planctomycetaceae bacterium]|nr:colicin V production protein [Planctomycetaceae bacterium]